MTPIYCSTQILNCSKRRASTALYSCSTPKAENPSPVSVQKPTGSMMAAPLFTTLLIWTVCGMGRKSSPMCRDLFATVHTGKTTDCTAPSSPSTTTECTARNPSGTALTPICPIVYLNFPSGDTTANAAPTAE